MTVEQFERMQTADTEDHELVEGALIPLSTYRHAEIRSAGHPRPASSSNSQVAEADPGSAEGQGGPPQKLSDIGLIRAELSPESKTRAFGFGL